MNGNVNTAKWLRYLMYVGIATLVNIILVNIPFFSGLCSWISIAISAATVFLLFNLEKSNEHYQTAAVLYTVSLAISVLNAFGITILSLVGSICALVAEYKEYHSHGELIEERDPKLADKWGSLFWLQFAVSIVATLLSAVLITGTIMAAGMEEGAATSIAVAVVATVTLLMQLLYLSYLKRTIVLLENESAVE